MKRRESAVCKTFNPLNNIFIHFARWDDETAKVDIHQKSNIYHNLDTDEIRVMMLTMIMKPNTKTMTMITETVSITITMTIFLRR